MRNGAGTVVVLRDLFTSVGIGFLGLFIRYSVGRVVLWLALTIAAGLWWYLVWVDNIVGRQTSYWPALAAALVFFGLRAREERVWRIFELLDVLPGRQSRQQVLKKRLATNTIVREPIPSTREGFRLRTDRFVLPRNTSTLDPRIKRAATICNLFLNQKLGIDDIARLLDEDNERVILTLLDQRIILDRRDNPTGVHDGQELRKSARLGGRH